MNPSTPTNERGPPARSPSVPEPLRAGAFWSAVLLPFCSLALLASGLGTTAEYLLFGSLVAANVAALIAGHGYGR
ncbi:uncharacterized protein Nmlp_2033 [Natronomonas moolapensis 8.8.11]|uniref:Uncharacterized protein n=1 Tax=Natronomonas moolapensis (strain DSM 18674 / CECT 7526 / JCM 14361 / 8.8.11) TaxID=268739 RepID=M1Y139_NATM8|nr:hypothetical protein [Natronomonas moolapensis]CCQ36205.1 uncharacterized protein Nmlp_2021 [Natronomonas moolapensis 8.8.11]CCQ36217.1 uncharacterized protein Nmlp_2033 [Natronomonas moolapensis 8.8.11]